MQPLAGTDKQERLLDALLHNVRAGLDQLMAYAAS